MTIKGALSLLFHRSVIIIGIILFQVFFLMSLMAQISDFFAYFDLLGIIISVIAVFWIVDKWMEPGYKIAWIIPILVVPVFGGLLYLFFGGNRTSRRLVKKIQIMDEAFVRELAPSDKFQQLHPFGLDAVNQSRYLETCAHFPAYSGTESTFFPLADLVVAPMLDALRHAERYIFLEYFIINKGDFWQEILDILVERVEAGVEVRIIYDDVGSMFSLPQRYPKQLKKMGISCRVFHPFVPVLSTYLNHRDHRKLCIIDGHTAFMGGFNLADEYINKVEHYGHWKDNAISLKGEGVWSMVVMFLTMWDYIQGTPQDYQSYRPTSMPALCSHGQFVQPYADSPLDDEPTGESVYLNLIHKAERYVYITTPYLIPSDNLIRAMTSAAKNGVDIRIITPHIPDKKIVFELTRAHYETLLKAGVRIYEYTPGFMHGKLCIVDDLYAAVGSVNFDYRSMFLHFEAGVWLCHDPCIIDMREDFMNTLPQSAEIHLNDCLKLPWPRRTLRAVLRIFAPFL